MTDYLSGEPDLVVGELQVWVHNRSDEDWLSVTAKCASHGATVITQGEIVHLLDIETFLKELEALQETKKGKATLSCTEPSLWVELKTADRLGHLNLTVKISPDYVNQSHTFQSTIDQTYLPNIVRAGKQ